MINAMNELYLAHHGIKGQHWGVRRFQDEDGTMTAAGRKRHRTREEKWRDKMERKIGGRYDRQINKLEKRSSKKLAKYDKKISKLEAKSEGNEKVAKQLEKVKKERSTYERDSAFRTNLKKALRSSEMDKIGHIKMKEYKQLAKDRRVARIAAQQLAVHGHHHLITRVIALHNVKRRSKTMDLRSRPTEMSRYEYARTVEKLGGKYDSKHDVTYDPSHRKVKHYDNTSYITSDYYASRPVCYVTRRTK
jgi:hypothetical protein